MNNQNTEKKESNKINENKENKLKQINTENESKQNELKEDNKTINKLNKSNNSNQSEISNKDSFNESIISYNTFKKKKEKQVKELKLSNSKLLEENTKFQLKITQLENKIKIESNKNYKSATDTTSKYLLPSEIKETWEELAKQNIGDCFIDLFEQPYIVYHIIQEMFYIMSKIIEERKNFIKSVEN